MYKILVLILATFMMTGCSMDIGMIMSQVADELAAQRRVDPDFVASEIVTTSNGVVFTGAFGEISEKKVLSSGVVFEGAFYQ